MTSNKQITECFKMKKPRPSPAKDAVKQCKITPKRRAPRRKITPSKTPDAKLHCRDDPVDDSFRESQVDYTSRDPDFWLCSQDVPVSDIGWDYGSPRNKVLKVKKKGESDVASFVKLFRHSPAETRPNPGVWDFIEGGFSGLSTTPAREPREKTRQRKDDNLPNRQVLLERMQGLLQVIENNKNGIVEPAESTERVEETLEVKLGMGDSPCFGLTAHPEELPLWEGVASEGCADEGDWADGDDSILVAATQDAEMAAAPLRPVPRSTPKRPKTQNGEVQVKCASPFRQNAKSKSPGLRKSPRLQLLLLGRKSPPKGPSAIPETTEVPATPVRSLSTSPSKGANGNFKDIMDNLLSDDDDDALLDWACSSYEQAQQLAQGKTIQAKNVSLASPRNVVLPQAAAFVTFCIPEPPLCSSTEAVTIVENIPYHPPGTKVKQSSTAVPGMKQTTPVVVVNKIANVPKVCQTASNGVKHAGKKGSTVHGAVPKVSGQKMASPLRSPKQEVTTTKPSGTEWDDDDEFTTPEVMSWLEKVESQTTSSQRRTPEEIERKRREALLRRQQKSQQQQQQWKGRLRPPK